MSVYDKNYNLSIIKSFKQHKVVDKRENTSYSKHVELSIGSIKSTPKKINKNTNKMISFVFTTKSK